MKKTPNILKCLFLSTWLITCFFISLSPAAGDRGSSEFDKNIYHKDSIPVNGGSLSVLVDKKNNKVEWFWDNDDDIWAKDEDCELNLQDIYDNRESIRRAQQLTGMQLELDRIHLKSWFEKKDQ